MARSDQTEKHAEMPPKLTNDKIVGETSTASTIEQVRDLLFGGAQRSIEQQIGEVRSAFEATVSELRAHFTDQIFQLETKLHNLAQDSENKHLASFQDIGAAISELGSVVSNLGSARKVR